MASTIVKTVFQFRRDTTANWIVNKDVVPAAGEPCFDLDLHTLKIGDGKKTYEQLPAIGGVELKVEADGKSVVLENDVFKLMGFDAAEVGAQPRKTADGKLEWVVPSTETVEGLQATVAGLQSDVTNLQTNVTKIENIITPSGDGAVSLLDRVAGLEHKMDGEGEGTVDAKIDAKINEFATNVTDDKVVNSYKELIDYVADHGGEAATMAANIGTLQELVGETSVADQIAAAGHVTMEDVSETMLSKAEAAATLKHVDYEVSHKPAGTMVDYRDKEIRIMCPAATEWNLQNSGEGANPNLYYIGFKAYAPANAVSFKEDLAEIIADDTMYTFEGNDFAGVDAYGRKYSIVWLPVASYDTTTDSWTYYGVKSNKNKYIGWYYSVEWFDANGKKIATDTIRVNLSNEDCHNSIEPYYMANVVKSISMGGTLLDVVNSHVEIPAYAGLKGSEEIVIAEDGTLGVGEISFDKITQGSADIVFDGGSAAN